MAFNNSLLTQFLVDCNIRFTVDDGVVSFEYDNRYFLGAIRPTEAFDSSLVLILPGIQEVKPFDSKNYLKYINQLNGQVPVAKFVLDEQNNSIYIEAEIPLDSSPELDDLVPGLVKLLIEAYNTFHNVPQQQTTQNPQSYNTPSYNTPSYNSSPSYEYSPYNREIVSKVKAIVVDKLGVDESEVTFNADFANDLGADSLDGVELIMQFEKEFGVTIPDDQAEKIITEGDAIAYIDANAR